MEISVVFWFIGLLVAGTTLVFGFCTLHNKEKRLKEVETKLYKVESRVAGFGDLKKAIAELQDSRRHQDG